MMTDDAQRHPVEGLARLLLQHAREDPTLLARSQIGAVPDVWPEPRPLPRPALAPAPTRAANAAPLRVEAAGPERRELEQLVSMAVASAHRAEDACRQAQEVGWMARRRMTAVAAIAAVAALTIVGGAGSVMVYRNDKQAELGAVVSAVHDVSALQQQTAAQLAAIGLDVAALRDQAATLPASSTPVSSTPASSTPAEPDAQDAPAMAAAADTAPEAVAPDAAAPGAASEPSSELAKAPPLPPAIYVPPHAYPPPPAPYLPADALRSASAPRHPPLRRSHNVSAVSMFVGRLFAHR